MYGVVERKHCILCFRAVALCPLIIRTFSIPPHHSPHCVGYCLSISNLAYSIFFWNSSCLVRVHFWSGPFIWAVPYKSRLLQLMFWFFWMCQRHWTLQPFMPWLCRSLQSLYMAFDMSLITLLMVMLDRRITCSLLSAVVILVGTMSAACESIKSSIIA